MSGLATTFATGDAKVGLGRGGRRAARGSYRGPDERGVGEVQFRGPSVIRGYWNDADATAKAVGGEGWLSTGDLGYLDEDGDLFLVDRKNEMIIRGGYNVYPREVEEVLYEHPGVLEAAVVGVPDEMLGEDVAAVVVARPGRCARSRRAEGMGEGARRRVQVPAPRSCSSTSCRRARPGRSSSVASISPRLFEEVERST